MSEPAKPTTSITLRDLEDSQCYKRAKIDGMLGGGCAALLGTLISTHALRLPRNTALVAGLLTGIASGYYLSQAMLSACLKSFEAKKQIFETKKENGD